MNLRYSAESSAFVVALGSIIHQIAVYAGVPLAVQCFRAARKVFAELDKGA